MVSGAFLIFYVFNPFLPVVIGIIRAAKIGFRPAFGLIVKVAIDEILSFALGLVT